MEHLFENGGMPTRPTSGYDNEEIPDSMPLQNQGAIPVLVRLVVAGPEVGDRSSKLR